MPIPASSEYSGRRVTVMGLGRFGGGVGAVRFLAARGARLTITDTATAPELAEPLAEIDGLPIETMRLGGHRDDDFTGAELVVASPAIPRTHPLLAMARSAGVPVTSEMNLFFTHHRGYTVGVTGSNGKSTTTAMIHSILKAAGLRSRIGGNIGRSLLPVVDEIGPHDWTVLELSSFQLEDLDALRASPEVAVVTNFSPNHLDRHGTLDEYRRTKQTILRWQSAGGVAVLNGDDPDVSAWPTRGARLLFGTSDVQLPGAFLEGNDAVWRRGDDETRFPLLDWLKLPGRHNAMNALAAASAALVAGATLDAVRAGLESYEPLPHRLQLVAETKGRRFYNDSLATTPESTIVALESFQEPIVLLAGGYDKQVDLSGMAAAIARGAKAVALMGQTAGTLEGMIRRLSVTAAGPELRLCGDFDEAFAFATSQSQPGDVVLLSPGCASYDWFRNFADRGEQFARRAKAWRP